MNASTTYWLCRAQGSPTEGPFTLGQITSMYGAGSVTAQALLSEVGSNAWLDIVELLEGGGKVAFIHSRKLRVGGSTLLAVCLFLIGLLLLISPLILIGVAIMAASGLVGAKYRMEHFCSDCGNTVAATSMKCPACKADLDLPPQTWKQHAVKVFWWLLYAVIFFCIGMMIVNGMSAK